MDAVASALSLFRGYNTLIREYGNGIAFSLCLVLVFVLGSYLFNKYRMAGTFTLWRRSDGTQTACALWWLLIAEGMRALCAYIPLQATNDGVRLNSFTEDLVSFGFAAAVILLTIVLFRSIFLFQPPRKVAATLLIAAAIVGAFLWGGEARPLIEMLR